MNKKNTLKVGLRLNSSRAKFLRPGDELKWGTERWTVIRVSGTYIYFKRSGAGKYNGLSVRYDTECKDGWNELTITKLAKGVDVRSVTKLTGADVMRMVEMNKQLIRRKAELHRQVLELTAMVNELIDASDELSDAGLRRTKVWNNVRAKMGRPRLSSYQRAKAEGVSLNRSIYGTE